jgi:hypothetical protein
MSNLQQFLAQWYAVTPDNPEGYRALLVDMINTPDLASFGATARLFAYAIEQHEALLDE